MRGHSSAEALAGRGVAPKDPRGCRSAAPVPPGAPAANPPTRSEPADRELFRHFNLLRSLGRYDEIDRLLRGVRLDGPGADRFAPYFKAALLTDFGRLDHAARVLANYFSGDTFADMTLLAAMLEVKDYHGRRAHNPWSALPVEFPLYLYPGERIFTALHPQNLILKQSPPTGYAFTTELRSTCRGHAGDLPDAEAILAAVFAGRGEEIIPRENLAYLRGFLAECRRRGIGPQEVAAFFRSRQLAASMLVPAEARKVFLGAYAAYIGPRPWLVWVENWSTLFQPYAATGNSWDFDADAREVRPLLLHLAMPNCKAVVTHLRSTQRGLEHLLARCRADHKVAYVPLSYPERPRKPPPEGPVRMLFMNSYGGCARQFVNRGGLELIQALRMLPATLRGRWELFLLGRIPYGELSEGETRFLKTHPHITVIESFLPDADIERIMARSDLFLIPSRSFHSCCVVQAFAHGVPVVATRCWGYEEFIRDGENGWLVRRNIDYNRLDADGLLREIETPVAERSDPVFARRLAETLARLIGDRPGLEAMSRNAHATARAEFSIGRRNELLARLL